MAARLPKAGRSELRPRSFSRETGNSDYAESINHLIREENRHSSYLGAFMKQQGIRPARRTWTDGIFRVIRRLAGIETNIRVLVTAELIALTYYDVLGRSTGSEFLKRVCERMLEEEKKHVAFQMHHLHWMNFRKFPLFTALSDLAHAVLVAGTLLAVWVQHYKVLGRSYTFAEFAAKVWGEFRDTMDQGRESALRELLGDEAFERLEAESELPEKLEAAG